MIKSITPDSHHQMVTIGGFGAKEKQSQYEESDTHFESKNIKQIRPKI